MLGLFLYLKIIIMTEIRLNKTGAHRGAYERNKKIILRTQEVCGICGYPVDKSLKYPDPMSATIDHIIPINKGGHPSDIDNMQLAHFACNRQKSDKIFKQKKEKKVVNGNRNLPLSKDWQSYRSDT